MTKYPTAATAAAGAAEGRSTAPPPSAPAPPPTATSTAPAPTASPVPPSAAAGGVAAPPSASVAATTASSATIPVVVKPDRKSASAASATTEQPPTVVAAAAAGKWSRTRPGSIYKPYIEHTGEPLYDQWLDGRRFLTTWQKEANAFALLLKRARRYPTRTALTWLDDDANEVARWSFGDLMERVRGVARVLRDTEVVGKGERVVLCYPPGLEFFVAFWACLSVGAVAVPVTPPDPFAPGSDPMAKLAAIVGDCTPKLVLSERGYINSCKVAAVTWPKAAKDGSPLRYGIDFTAQRWRATDDVQGLAVGAWDFPTDLVTQQTLAFLQYTSGSTGVPKGVMVTHGNLLANCASCCAMTHALDTPDNAMQCVTVSWLPTFHDMGLIGFHVTPLLAGGCVAAMSPLSFVANPLGWLKACSQFTRTITGAPPFALDMCTNKLTPERLRAERVDLSSLMVVFLGAAPILDSTLTAFANKFKPFGFRAEVFAPSYGLAENVLFATGKKSNQHLPPRLCIDHAELEAGRLTPFPSAAPGAEADAKIGAAAGGGGSRAPRERWVVSSGEVTRWALNTDPSLPAVSDRTVDVDNGCVVIVDPATGEEVPDGRCGEIWICGSSKASGYWHRETATEETFGATLRRVVTERTRPYAARFATFLRSGDVGAVHRGQLYVTGRLKEMIIVHGANFYPADLHEAVHGAHPAVRPGGTVAFAIDRVDAHGTAREGVAIVVELQPRVSLAANTSGSRVGDSISSGSTAPAATAAAPSSGRRTLSWTDWSKQKVMRVLSLPLADRAVGVLLPLALATTALVMRLPMARKSWRLLRWAVTLAAKRAGPRFGWLAGASAAAVGVTSSSSSSASGGSGGPQRFGYTEAEAAEIARAVRTALLRQFAVPVADLVLVAARTIPKTSSGKLRVADTRAALAAGKFDAAIVYRHTAPVPVAAGTAAGQQIGTSTTTAVATPATLTGVSTPLAVSGLASATPGGSLSSFRTGAGGKPTLRPRGSLHHHFDMKTPPPALSSSSASGAQHPSTPHPPRLKVSTVATTPMSATLVTPGAYAKRVDATPRSAHPAARGWGAQVPPSPSPFVPSATPPAASATEATAAGSGGGSSVPPLDVEQVKAAIREALTAEFASDANESGTPPPTITDATALDTLGLDSLKAMALTKRLAKAFALPGLSPFLFLADPTVAGIAREVVRLHAATHCGAAGGDGAGVTVEEEDAGDAAAEPFDPAVLPHILGLGTALPATGGPQATIVSRMADLMGLGAADRARFERIGTGSHVATRYMVQDKLEDVFFGRTGLDNDAGIEPRNAVFKEQAPRLAVAAAERALSDWGGDRARITHVVAVTCTGVLVPGLEFELMTRLGLAGGTERLGLVYMGCFGAVSGLKTAKALAAERPGLNRVLMVCCELCSLHMQLNAKVDNLIASALFSDGAGAAVLGCQPGSGGAGERSVFECHRSASAVIPQTLDAMSWELSKSGMIIGLSKHIPAHIYQAIGPFARALLRMAPRDADAATAAAAATTASPTAAAPAATLPPKPADCVWAVHPGGPLILKATSDVLGLPEQALQVSYDVLRDCGNMSSATLLFVLDRIRTQKLAAGRRWVPALAFGPGLNNEAILLRASE